MQLKGVSKCVNAAVLFSIPTVCKWLGVYLCMRESPATTPAVIDKYNMVIVAKGI